uniref:Psoralen synthase-like n=1 Tax=Nicotiana tabacum TaxID=4097 RepID=A0A1S3YM12_TOBAC|nr:PREDICTED: psoralen synthase-like [Nicotiana tabacum]
MENKATTFKTTGRVVTPLIYLQLGQVSTVVISSPSIAKQVLNTHDPAFANRAQLTSSNIMFYNNNDIAFSQYGNYRRQMRKICIVEILSMKMVKSFREIRQDELSSLISLIRSMKGSPVNMTDKIFWFTNSITCKAAFGNMFKDRDEFMKLMKEDSDLVFARSAIAFATSEGLAFAIYSLHLRRVPGPALVPIYDKEFAFSESQCSQLRTTLRICKVGAGQAVIANAINGSHLRKDQSSYLQTIRRKCGESRFVRPILEPALAVREFKQLASSYSETRGRYAGVHRL